MASRRLFAQIAVCAVGVASVASLAVIGAGSASAAAPDPGAFTAVAPTRLLDTRSNIGGGTVAAQGTISLTVSAGSSPVVPANGVSAVVLNITVVNPKATGFITAYADGTTKPTASNLNFSAGQTVPNLVVAPVGANGKVDLFNGSTTGSTDLIADVSGWFEAGTPTLPGAFVSVAPTRLLDTRSPGGSAARAKTAIAFQVTGQGGVPAGATEAVLNVTVTQPTAGGFVTGYADGATQPTSSNLNFSAGQTVPNLVVAPIGADGKVALYNGSTGTTQLLADVAGYFVPGAAATVGAFSSVVPARALDTRDGEGLAAFYDGTDATVAGNSAVKLQVTGRNGVPKAGVSAVILNVTATNSKTNGFITAYADGSARPTASNLCNLAPGQTVPNLVVVPVSADGVIELYNGSPLSTDLIADVAGYFLSTAGASPVAAVHVGNCIDYAPDYLPEPAEMALDCFSDVLFNMTWTSWTATTATGSGSIGVYRGEDAHGNDIYDLYSVTVQMSGPASSTCGSQYTQVAIAYPGGESARLPTGYLLPTDC